VQSGERNEWHLIPNHPFTTTLTQNIHPAEKLIGHGREKKSNIEPSEGENLTRRGDRSAILEHSFITYYLPKIPRWLYHNPLIS